MPANSEKSNAKAKAKAKAKTKTEDTTTDLSVGEILRRARVAEKLSLDKVEEDIRIRASMLQAVEDMDLDKIPGWIYTVGFVRSYSEYLELDGDKMVSLLKTQVGEHKREELHFPVVAQESSLPDPWIIGVAAVGLLVVVGAVFAFQNFKPQAPTNVNDIPPVPAIIQEANQVAEQTEAPQVAVEDETQEQAPETEELVSGLINSDIYRDENGVLLPQPKPAAPQREEGVTTLSDYRIIIDVVDESWIEIKNSSGETLVSRVLKVGDQYYVPQNVTGLTMTTGNVAGIKLTVDGQVLNLSSTNGDIQRDIPLDPESLKEMYP